LKHVKKCIKCQAIFRLIKLNIKELYVSGWKLIGIRGSGKSSILEMIRYALDIPFGDKSLDTDYKTRLVEHALGSGGRITLWASDQRGQQYEIRRISREKPDVYVNGILQPGISIRETVIHKPIYFGQKDLSSTGEGFEKDLVEKLVGEKLAGIRARISDQRQKVAEIVSRLKKLVNVDEKKKEFKTKKQDAEFRLEFYKKHGVEERLQKQVDFDAVSRKCTQVITSVQSYLRDLDSFINQYEDDLKNQRIYTSKQNKEFFDSFFAEYVSGGSGLVFQHFDYTRRVFSLVGRHDRVVGGGLAPSLINPGRLQPATAAGY